MDCAVGTGFLILNTAHETAGGALEIPIWISSYVLFLALFILLGVGAVVQAIRRTREDDAPTTEKDLHRLVVPQLGTTMADGGRPASEAGSREAPADSRPQPRVE